MSISARSVFFLASLTPLLALASDNKWLYAGESGGIAFQLRITSACKDGSKVDVRLKSASDEDVTVRFRLNDADWRKTFTRELKAGAREATLSFVPEDSQVCHPYVDQVEIASAAASDPAPSPPPPVASDAPGIPPGETAGGPEAELP